MYCFSAFLNDFVKKQDTFLDFYLFNMYFYHLTTEI